jgi:TetR/AcrR family acrAB operon transcriptional repressor
MVRKSKQESERTYHTLLDAATGLFIRQGVAKTTLNEIARAAEMTRGAVYWHFANKDAVIKALWERNAQEAHHGFLDALAHIDPDNPAIHFRQIVKDILMAAADDPKLSQALRIIMHCIEFSDEETELQRFLFAKREEIALSLESAIATLAELRALRVPLQVDVVSHALLSFIYGLLHAHLEPGLARVELKAHGEAMLDLLLDGILVK